jgi:hypothetical protein
MHETYRILAENRTAELMREAAAGRLAAEARMIRSERRGSGLVRRLRSLRRSGRAQARPATACDPAGA